MDELPEGRAVETDVVRRQSQPAPEDRLRKKRDLAGVGIWALSYEAGRPELWNGMKAVIEGTVSSDGSPAMPGTGGSGILNIIPNPVKDKALVSCYISRPCTITITIYDQDGRVVEVTEKASLPPGIMTSEIDAGKLAPGIYFCVLNTGEGRSVRKFAVAGN